MISEAPTVAAFLKTVSPEERAVFGQIRKLLKQAHPKVKESMQYRMPTYQLGGESIGGFNKQKHYLCLYLTPEAVDPYRKELQAAGLDCGKCCLRFRQPQHLPLALAARIIRAAVKLAAATKDR